MPSLKYKGKIRLGRDRRITIPEEILRAADLRWKDKFLIEYDESHDVIKLKPISLVPPGPMIDRISNGE